MADQIKKLKSKRVSIKGRITRIEKFIISQSDNVDLCGVKSRVALLDSLFMEFNEVQDEIEFLEESSGSDASFQERDSLETQYFSIKSKMDNLINLLEKDTRLSNNCGSSATSNNKIRLPEINLPKFSGAYDEWYNFYNAFDSLINSDEDLSKIQKFQYLKSALQSEAATYISSLEISSDNYDLAWDMLKDRYDNKRLIISKHIRYILDLPSAAKENYIILRRLHDELIKHLRVLKSLKRPVEHWDDLLIAILINKLDPVTIKEWESNLPRKSIPTLKNLTDFLSHKCGILEAIAKNPATISISNQAKLPANTRSNTATHMSVHSISCNYCSGSHLIYNCEKFLLLPIQQRIKEVRVKKLCLNCLKAGHNSNNCNYGSCKKCSKKHNTLLHTVENHPLASISNHVCCDQTFSQVLLSTAIINIRDQFGQYHRCRALLDSGSQSCFITDSLVNRLKLQRGVINMPVAGINQTKTNISSTVQVNIKSRFNGFSKTLNCLILKNITEQLPISSFNCSNLKIPKNIKLADPNFNISGNIDILIGAELFWDLLCVGQIKENKNDFILQKTHLGWIACGTIYSKAPQRNVSCNFSINSNLEDQIAKFWELERCSDTPAYTQDEKCCENHFLKTHKRDNEGRFIVSIPFKSGGEGLLGDSKAQALKRFYTLERKLNKNEDLKREYAAFMNEYISLGHMKLVDNVKDISESSPTFYLPHHAVLKQSSRTTKLRVVFDGSAPSTTGISINDIQLVGPVIQQDLWSILLRFRTHKFVMVADIAKMYRQVLVEKDQTRFQRILWRSNDSEPIRTYELATVTYGTASASFLATRSLHQLAVEESNNYPIGAKIAQRDFYVDDLLTGSNTIVEAKQIQSEIRTMLSSGGFELRKWISNNTELINNIDSNDQFATIILDKEETVSTLGLQWNAHTDSFIFSVPQYKNVNKITKRIILSNIAQIFDPLGLIGPVIVIAKLIMQKLWQLKISWDESVPISIHTEWQNFTEHLSLLNHFSVPRWIINCDKPSRVELHGFSDASEAAYGASIYIRTYDANNCLFSHLICSKSRIAPLKNISLPKLELCGALLLAQLMHKAIKSLALSVTSVYYWTDSSIVLTWIKNTARTWKTFVANRVSEIQDLSSPSDWHHVQSKDNPADIISRGATMNTLIESSMWWHGPSNIFENISLYLKSNDNLLINQVIPERRATIANVSTSPDTWNIFSKFSNYLKLIRVTALCWRFINNIKHKLNKSCSSYTGSVTVAELNTAISSLVKIVQKFSFARELHDLKLNKSCNSKSKLLCLNPFVDEDGIIKVGGRLRHASIPVSHKHPMIIPSNHPFTRLIIEHEHRQNFHAGIQSTLAAVRQSYWPIAAKGLIRKIIRECVTCFKANPKPAKHIMGDLPKDRVTPSRPFFVCGVDYFGPLYIREGKRRNSKTSKAYGAIFVCFATKAVHIELTTDLTTETFIAALKRFIARRGKPSNIYSDNATNFVGAKHELKGLHDLFTNEYSQQQITESMSNNGIQWHFIPPRSPHFGGIWEAAVKSTKRLLRKIVGNASLRYEEMYTILTQIESILNSRPLTLISDDPNDLSFLTPSHFLIGDSLTSVAEPNILNVAINRLSRWQFIERLRQHFWSRWSKEYLTHLQQRSRWSQRGSTSIKPGQLVLIREDNSPPLRWPMGRIEEVHPGKDGVVRAATVFTASGSVKRATIRLCPLPIETVQCSE